MIRKQIKLKADIIRTFNEIIRALIFKYFALKRIFGRISKKEIYYVIGDSHTLSFQHEAFKIFHIGPATAFRLSSKKSTTKSRDKVLSIINKIYKGEIINVIFVFGEIDTRIHINKIANEKAMPIDKVIDNTVRSYIGFLKFVKQQYPLINIYVFNLLPQGEEGNIYNYPFYAARKERIKIAEKMNKSLRIYTEMNNLRFIYIYDQLIDKKSNRKKQYTYDLLHYNRKIMPLVLKELHEISFKDK